MLEYGCHVRDVLLVQRERMLLSLVEETPHVVSMYRDVRAYNARYNNESLSEVAQELVVAANLAAKLVEVLSTDQLGRYCIYSYPEPKRRDLAWVTRHTVHEVVHHERDVRQVRTRVVDVDEGAR